ncbi:MAG TPA: hypothetical protein VK168_11245 [Saprospiraceae bacterium]|nr:hypothetical protein [Saprospiraceae bacterium]
MALTICTGQFEAMRQLQLFFFLSILCPTVQGQMHDNNWIFGYTFPSGNTDGTLLHFENGFPEFTLENVGQDYFYYCILCSDSTGNLLFHTDGRQIRNKLHQIMDGGEIINPGQMWIDFYDGYPSVTGGLSIPAPGLENFYYIVHTTLKDGADPNILCPELLYSKIDMNANGGLGKVVEKNKVIANGDLPSPVIIKHGNGRDWWLVVGEYVSKTYLVYLIDKQGINLIHQLNIAPASLTNQSYAEASPDGTFFVSNDNITGLWVFDFDRCTGLLNNPRILPYQPQVFWTSTIAFSHDGRFLYLGTSLLVYQLDMQTIDNTEITIDTISRYEFGASPAPPHMTQFFLPELAPNNKIYFGTFNNSTAYHVINRPNLPLLASDMSQRGLLLPRHNMETRCYFPNYRLGKWLDSPCDSLATVPGSNVRFRDNQWTERNLGVSNDTVKILKLPTSFFIPAATDVFPEESFNPLNMNYLFRQQLAQKRSGKTEKLPSSSIKNE